MLQMTEAFDFMEAGGDQLAAHTRAPLAMAIWRLVTVLEQFVPTLVQSPGWLPPFGICVRKRERPAPIVVEKIWSAWADVKIPSWESEYAPNPSIVW